MNKRGLRFVLLVALLVVVPSSVGAESYAALFDTWWLPLVHDWTQQLHEPEGAEFRRVEVPEARDIFWEKGGGSFSWTELQLRRSEDTLSTSLRGGNDNYIEVLQGGLELSIRRAGNDGFPIATYQRVDESTETDTIAGEWDFRGRPLTIVEVPWVSSLDLFILHEEVPVVDIPRGTYIIERVSDGVMKAETFDLLDPFYILFDPTDDERLWLTTEEEGPEIEPWVDYRGLDVAYLYRLDESRFKGR